MIRGLENLVKFVEQNDCPYWKVYPHGASRSNYFFQSGTEDNLSMSNSILYLRERLSGLEPGRYVIQCKKNITDTKSIPEAGFELTGENAQHNINANMAQVNGAGYSDEKVAKMIADALKTDRAERLVEDLTKKVDELSKENKELQGNGAGPVLDRIFQRAEPLIGKLMDHHLPPIPTAKIAAVGYAGNSTDKDTTVTIYTKPANPPTTPEESGERLTTAIEAWCNLDPQRALAMIETIVSTAQHDTKTYDFYANMLLK